MVDASKRTDLKLKCDLCGNGPFVNNFGVAQHKIERCPQKKKTKNWRALHWGVMTMSFELAFVEKVYKDLKEPYHLEMKNLERIYKNKNIDTYRRKLGSGPEEVYCTECILCTMTWPCDDRICLETVDEFVKHNIDHILENRLENIQSPQRSSRKTTSNVSLMQNKKNQSSVGTTPMKKPKNLGKFRSVQEQNEIDGTNGVEVQEVLELHTNQDDESILNDKKQIVQQKEQNGNKKPPKQKN